jgi:site-specific recombinase
MRDLNGLLDTLNPDATLVQRHLWLAAVFDWIRGDRASVPAAVARIGLLLEALQARPDKALQARRFWQTLNQTLDVAVLLSDFGFSSRNAFISELSERLRLKLLPTTPETTEASVLFSLVLSHSFDAQWLLALDEAMCTRIVAALQPHAELPVQPSHWQSTLLEALTICTSQVRGAGFAAELRLRMSPAARAAAPFHPLAADLDQLRICFVAALQAPADDQDPRQIALQEALQKFRAQLDACRAAATSVYAHLDEHGVSVSLVFRVRQVRERILRIRALIDCLSAPRPALDTTRLLAHLVLVGKDRRSLRSLVASNSSMLAAKVTERSSEVGEHYITRTSAEYRDMLGKAAGGGALTALTTWLKFAVMAFGLSAFWNGFWSSVAYAGSFVVIQLMHYTLATKQPAMTAPAMAARLKDINEPSSTDGFVDEVTHLVRSQVAAVLGNVGVVFPLVVLVSFLMQLQSGHPMLDAKGAAYVLHSLNLLGPSALFAAITGVLLFASSIIAGWTENAFVFYRLDSALRYNPLFTHRLGARRCDRWATFLRNNISGFASNISLGVMLGMVPEFAAFFGLGLQLRHVTLSSGQLAAAAASIGWDVLRDSAFWWCVAAIPVIGALNLSVSFYCAFRLALLSHNIGRLDRVRIRHAILARLRHKPLEFFFPTGPHVPVAKLQDD